jgi:hypothetical protein
MKPILFFVGLLAAAVLTISAQDAKPLPPRTMREAVGTPSASSEANGDGHPQAQPYNLFFCPPDTCLYYAGDYDTISPNWNGLFDIDNPGIGISDAEVWVGVKPTKSATITGVSGNFGTNNAYIGTNPTPVRIRTGLSTGHAGKLVCRSGGVAVVQWYGGGNVELDFLNYYIQKLSKPCRVKAGKIYYVTMQPQYGDGETIGYLWDDDGAHANKLGWPEIADHSYFNSSSFGVNFEPTWGNGGACGGIGCSGFSISLTGKQQ